MNKPVKEIIQWHYWWSTTMPTGCYHLHSQFTNKLSDSKLNEISFEDYSKRCNELKIVGMSLERFTTKDSLKDF